MMKKILFVLLFSASLLHAQPGALHLDMLIDVPTAKNLASGEILSELRMYTRGGLLATLTIGLTDRFFIGVSYGGENIIGTGNANMNPLPCVRAGYLIMAEQNLTPAILIGFNSQGYGGYDKGLERYAIKSKGVYGVLSKNTSFLGGLGVHIGINWSLETGDGDTSPNVFAGFHKWINSELAILADYDIAVNDNSKLALGSGKGYLNAGIRWTFAERVFVEFAWKNIFENSDYSAGSGREVKLYYLTSF